MRDGMGDDFEVRASREAILYRGDIVMRRAQGADNGKIAAFVSENAQSSSVGGDAGRSRKYGFFMGQRVGRIAHRRLDVRGRQARIGIEQFNLGGTLAHLAQQQFHWDTGAANHGFPEHDPGIDINSVGNGHGDILILQPIQQSADFLMIAVQVFFMLAPMY